ncbi:E3 ubiquitin-protein ligase UHRF1 isoform X2 [Microplitis demolitor]|nr:E3 ubiquitin-protein ligase UHRF1 isoform X2 [Microplitis demolitor]XP_053593956.1 E3 ubiquitin-protein ligase UHRF1 isoform X2 [Microplitis demolitor]XP_053593957.1 E3 ubiquitin-protein ligase UHRF1 isoform X2 [Microplitis demolitor]XP_053593958.1 E3 ubiquitin-protein ligase UHRF1 isoform X2 [Microplitis demolitor]XP_053593959.1 E3 ubiquitin-protein ligase UHRF1 isoform X2 [Microplitis demolitor]XP_053593960.1 E3 ubiquitin-protein ligase UHRF1 isoform X2 [Microplitis demolitor]XP_05359396
MFVLIRTIDGKVEKSLEISKTLSIRDFKIQVAKIFSTEVPSIQLFYRGKQLEDCYRVHDYHLNHHEVVQLLIKSEKSTEEIECSKDLEPSDEKCHLASVPLEENLSIIIKQPETCQYQSGDPVDCINEDNGAWFEAIVQNIYQDISRRSLIYRVQWKFLADTEPFDVMEHMIRPRAKHCLSINQIKVNDRVMVNYNVDEPKKIGYWYDFTVTSLNKSRRGVELVGILHAGSGTTEVRIENCKVNSRNKIYKIEKLSGLHCGGLNSSLNEVDKQRPIAIICKVCNDDINQKCKTCGCYVCLGKKNSRKIILCDECDKAYHIQCLNPPLDKVPEDDWYCPDCKIPDNLVIKMGENLKSSKKKIVVDLKKGQKDWGRGMGCMSRIKECTIVPTNHKGPIPGIEVGMSWKYRLQVSEVGLHRPHVAGIHGRENECAYSLVLSGGYEDDVDNGDEFLYTGSGGRDLSGNKRTAAQSSDQKLTKMNKALALNCNAQFNDVEGATAKDWQKGIPVRVIRAAKMRKHPQARMYAPEEGFRYDGIYKVVKYFPEKGKSGFLIWRYLLRRDDSTPAPWTSEGKQRVKSLGLRMIDYDSSTKISMTKTKTEINPPKKNPKRKRNKSAKEDEENNSKKIKVIHYELEPDLVELINGDKLNKKVWKDCCSLLPEGKINFINKVIDRFTCVCCLEIVWNPITIKCLHNICQNCLQRSFKADVYTCPVCRHPIKKSQLANTNKPLAKALEKLFPGYGSGRI